MKKSIDVMMKLFHTIATSGRENCDVGIMRKVKMINIMSVIAILILVPFGLIDLIKGHYTIGIFVHVIAAVLIFNILYLRKSGRFLFPIYCGTSIVAVYYLYALATGGINNTGYLWFFTFPLFSLFLLGLKNGAIAALLLLIGSILFFSISPYFSAFANYSMDFKIRFIASYLVVVSFSYLFEFLREKAQYSLSFTNIELKRTIADLRVTEEKLQKAGEELEQKVMERTERLANTLERLKRELEHRKLAEESLWESEEKFRLLAENTKDIICLHKPDGSYRYISPSCKHVLGYDPEELIGKDPSELMHPEDKETIQKESYSKVQQGQDILLSYRIRNKTGEYIWFESTNQVVNDEDGNSTQYVSVSRDITERKRAEQRLKASLKEKELLLQEIHHRVKNNMQVICSLLKLQSDSIEDRYLGEAFNDCQNRVRAMSLVHEKLYQSKDLSHVPFKDYLHSLIHYLRTSYATSTRNVEISFDIQEISFDIATAIPCGLIINELLSNSLKHAFPDKRKGEVAIALHTLDNNKIELAYSDNGIGIPKDIELKTTESLGLYLVSILAEGQLKGEIELERGEGTRFRIKFKI